MKKIFAILAAISFLSVNAYFIRESVVTSDTPPVSIATLEPSQVPSVPTLPQNPSVTPPKATPTPVITAPVAKTPSVAAPQPKVSTRTKTS